MGTRADFYLGRGESAEWLGSIAWDGNPASIPKDLLGAKDEKVFRQLVGRFLKDRDDRSLPADGWPWPWDTSSNTDYAYAFDKGHVRASSFGGDWFNPRRPQPANLKRKVAVFPNMKDAKRRPIFGKHSGVIVDGVGVTSVLKAIFDIDSQLAARQLPTIYDDQALLLLRAAEEGGGKVFDDAHALLDLLERRDRVNVDALREAIGRHELTVSGFEQYHTGGGCMALRRVLPSGDYLLITDEEGGSIPTGPAQTVAVGRYNADGECIGGDQNVHTIDVADILEWVRKQELN